MRSSIPCSLVALLVLGCGGGDVTVRIERGGVDVLEVVASVAETAEARARGLRGHPPLGPDEGLLIVMPAAIETCIVNDGVELAIDAVYAGEDGEVLAVERAIPAGDGTARCHDEVRRVLEVAAGVADPVRPGDALIVE